MDGRGPDGSPGGVRAPAVSLVLPVHNGERYLREALDSIFAQSFADFELIAVDDCSTDRSAAILAEYGAREPRMRVLTNTVNLKLPASLNRGFAEARGKWFGWTSDDNILRPNMLARLLEAARAHPDCDVIYSDYVVIDDRGNAVERRTVAPAEDLVLGNVVGCSFLYRAEVDRALGGYDENLFGLEDYDFWLRAAPRFRFHPLHEDLYLYRRHAGSLTSERGRQIRKMTARLMKREIDALPAGPRRAAAYVNLCCRDPYTLRSWLLWLALRDDPATLKRERDAIVRWLRYSIKLRLQYFGLALAVAPAGSAALVE